MIFHTAVSTREDSPGYEVGSPTYAAPSLCYNFIKHARESLYWISPAYIGYHQSVLEKKIVGERSYIWANFILFHNKTLLDWNGEGDQNSAQPLKDSIIGL